MDLNSQVIKTSEEDFDILHFLGKGSYGRVYQVRKKCGQDENYVYAMKVINKARIVKSTKKIERAFSERNVLKSIEHPFIVKLMYTFQSETKLYLILEYLCGGDLQNLLHKQKILLETSARFYLTEIILALEYLHSRDIIFRDLKPANILLDKYGHVKIVDFGLSKENISKCRLTYSTCGTLTYSAPEIIKKYGHGKEVDWWALGVLTFKMLTGRHPFSEHIDENLLAQNIVRGVYFFPSNLSMQSSAKDLIQHLLIVNPELRLGSSGAKDIKNHKFFKSTRWDQVLQRKQVPPFLPQVKSLTDVSQFTKTDSNQGLSSPLVRVPEIIQTRNELFNGFSFTSSEIPQLDNERDSDDVTNKFYNEASLAENNLTIRKKFSNALKSVKLFFNKAN